MKYEELRERYPVFVYHSVEIEESETEIRIRYDFEIEGLSHFNPEFVFPKMGNRQEVGSFKNFRNGAFSLGMIECISYWKLTCSPKFVVECGSLKPDQISWWKKLYFHGLGEFFYTNGIASDPETFMNLTSIGEPIDGEEDSRSFEGSLIPVGGGKDSLVTLELLKGQKETNSVFIINPIASALHTAKAAGYQDSQIVLAQRSLDPRMLDFNKQGFLNGHTPFSALAAFASYLAAFILQKKTICLSNESSANESTVKNSDVNHQYSKTFTFEQDFNDYIDSYLPSDIHYFSFLRPLSELQIAGLFSRMPQYFSVFRSCNVGQKEERWCGKCAKCLFVAIMLSAYVSDATIVSIFQSDILNDESLETLFQELTGMLDNKPFECVGTRDEVNTAICMSIRNHKQQGLDLPLLYQMYMQTPYYTRYCTKEVSWTAYNEENLLPKPFEEILKKAVSEMTNVG